MPFIQMVLFPTEFKLKTTGEGIRLLAKPISETDQLHGDTLLNRTSVKARELNAELKVVNQGPLRVKLNFTLDENSGISLYYEGNELITLNYEDLPQGDNKIEILIDKTVAEIFVNDGEKYILKQLTSDENAGLTFDTEKYNPLLNKIEVIEMKSIWKVKH